MEFTLDEQGTYPFVTHAFGDAVKGAIGVLQTENAPTAAGGHEMGGASHGATPTQSAPAGAADANVSFGDMWVKADTLTVKAGNVTFAVTNEGATTHGIAIAPAPANVSGGMVDESTLAVKGAELAGGESEALTADLKPGSYELICFLPGHYAAGQKMAFQVTG